MEASIEAFYNDKGGFFFPNTTFVDAVDLINLSGSIDTSKYAWPGVFNILICQLSADDASQYTPETFAQLLNEPDNLDQYPR